MDYHHCLREIGFDVEDRSPCQKYVHDGGVFARWRLAEICDEADCGVDALDLVEILPMSAFGSGCIHEIYL